MRLSEFHSQVVNIRFPTLSNILNLEVLTTETNNQTNKSTNTMIPNISLWEHSARMKLKEISACEKKTRDGSCDLGFFKTQNWFWMFFSQVQEIGVSLVLLLLFTYLYGETGFCLVQLVLVVVHSAQVSLLNLQNITCLMPRGYCLRLSFASLLGPPLPSSCHQPAEVNISLSCSVNDISAHQINYKKSFILCISIL